EAMTRSKAWATVALAASLAVGVPGLAYAAWYAKFDGIDGASKAAGHDKWIDLNAVNPTLTEQTPRGPGTLIINKLVDAASPKLKDAAASRKTFATIRLDFSAPGSPNTYLHYELKNVQITSY